MSASAIKDAFVTHLGAASLFGSNVSTNYKVLETSSACCCVVSLQGLNDVAMTMGNDRERIWTFRNTIYVKDSGNPVTLMNNVNDITSDVITSLATDDTLQGQAVSLDVITIDDFDPTTGLDVGGMHWKDVEILVDVHTWD